MAAAVVFDLDGTLVTFHFDMREWRKVLLAEVERHGYSIDGLDLSTPTQLILDAARSQALPGRPDSFESLKKDAYDLLDELELNAAHSATAYPGAPDALRRLKSAGLRLGVLTNSGRKAASESLRKTGLIKFLEFVITRDDIDSMKPRPDGLLKALSILRLSGKDAVYVGDTPLDIAAARSAGVVMVSVATGNYTRERLLSESPDFVIPDLGALPGVLGV